MTTLLILAITAAIEIAIAYKGMSKGLFQKKWGAKLPNNHEENKMKAILLMMSGVAVIGLITTIDPQSAEMVKCFVYDMPIALLDVIKGTI